MATSRTRTPPQRKKDVTASVRNAELHASVTAVRKAKPEEMAAAQPERPKMATQNGQKPASHRAPNEDTPSKSGRNTASGAKSERAKVAMGKPAAKQVGGQTAGRQTAEKRAAEQAEQARIERERNCGRRKAGRRKGRTRTC